MKILFIPLNLILVFGALIFSVVRPMPNNTPSGSMGFYLTENLIITFFLICGLLGINTIWLILFIVKKMKSKK